MQQFKILVISIFLCASYNSQAQFGIRLKYNDANFNNWENALKSSLNAESRLFSPGYEMGADYWFRLKKRRIEFMPEVAYAFSKTTYENASLDYLQYRAFNFNFHTHLYALDMEGDCDCPTFSKQGSGLNKGLFFHFTPGISLMTAEAVTRPESSFLFTENMTEAIVLRAGVGVGMDIGVSDLLTVTPIISYYFQSSVTWEGFPQSSTVQDDVSVNPNMLQLSLRLGFRPDYRRSSFRR